MTPIFVEVLWAIGAMVASLLIAALVLELWRADLSVPIFENQSDGTLTLASIKGLIEHGWYETNPSLGAPFGQINHDFPLYIGELGNVLTVKILALFSSNTALVLNVFILLSFPLAALTAFLVLRRLGLSRAVAIVCAILFAVAPYHFVRAKLDLFLGNYFALPISVYLILSVLGAEPLLTRRDGANGWLTAWLSRQTLTTIALSLIVGMAGLYYAVFTCLLTALGAAVTGLFSRRWSTLISGAVVVVAIAVPIFATALPEISYRAAHGANHVVANRRPVESIQLGLQPMQLVLPIPDDRIAPLRRLRARYDGGRGAIGTQEPLPPADSLGLVGAIGLLWLLAGVVAVGAGHKVREPLAGQAGAAIVMAILLGSVGGGGALLAYVITPQIRGWERIAVLVGFLALIGVGLLLEKARGWLVSRSYGSTLVTGILMMTIAFSVFEGTSPGFVPPYKRYAAVWHADASFVSQIQHALPRNAMVLELPYIPYPEVAVPSGLTSYSLLEPYLHSDSLRWSGGAMAGRPTDWLATSSRLPLTQLIPGAVAAGFAGLYIDREGYPEGGTSIAHEVQSITDTAPVEEENGKAYFFNLIGYATKLRVTTPPAQLAISANSIVSPISLIFAKGFYDQEGDGRGRTWHWARSLAHLEISSARGGRDVLSALLATGAQRYSQTRIRLPGGHVIVLPVSASGVLLRTDITLKPGISTVEFQTKSSAVPDVARDLHLQVINLSVDSI